MEITVGMKGEVGTTVEREDTALEVGSGSLLVYSLFIYTILLLPRYDLASLLIDAVFLYMPLILICGGRIKFQPS